MNTEPPKADNVETQKTSTPRSNAEAERYGSLTAAFLIAGIALVAIALFAIHWSVAAVWLGVCFISFAYAANECRKDAEKAPSVLNGSESS